MPIILQRTLLCCLCWWMVTGGAAAQETPRVVSFTKEQYQGHNQNWSVGQTREGFMVVGNAAGLLEFDGSGWRAYPLPDGQTIRAVATDAEGTVFTGAFGEFGYWQRGTDGKLHYHSLAATVQDEVVRREEFWHIIVHEGRVFFQSFSAIYSYDYKQVRLHTPPDIIMFMQVVHHKKILPVINRGLFIIKNTNGFDFITGSDVLAERRVVCMIPLQGEDYLVGTADSELFIYRGGQFVRWNVPLQAQLQADQLNKGIRLSNGNIALGTIRNGVYIINPQGDLLYHINQQNGLQNNTVLSLYEDRAQNLWVGLDKGIDLIEISSPLVFFKDKNGVIGSVYTASIFAGKLYLGSNQGVFVRDWPGAGAFRLVNGTQGQVWQLEAFDGQLIAGHNDGTFRIEGERAYSISDVTGGWTTLRHPGQPDLLLQGTYTGLVAFGKNAQGQWMLRNRIQGFAEPVKEMMFDAEGYLWVVNPNRGVYRIQLDEQCQNVVSIYAFQAGDGLLSAFKNDIEKIDNQIFIKSGGQFLQFDKPTGQLRPLSQLLRTDLQRDRDFLLKRGLGTDYLKIYNNKVVLQQDTAQAAFYLSLVPDFKSISLLNDSTYLFGLDDGYALLNRQELAQSAQVPVAPVRITGVAAFARPNALRFLDRQGSVALSPGEHNIRFYFTQPVFTRMPEYSYLLEGYDTAWSEWRAVPEREFNRLLPGDYTFRVRSNLSDEVAEVRFVVQMPWYQTWWAGLLYILLAGVVVWLVERWNQHRLAKQRLRLETEKEKQLEEQRIKAANERLQADVIMKSKELANSTMTLVQKNELLQRLKEEIRLVRDATDGQMLRKNYQRLLHLIDTNLSSEQDWQMFETNFTQVHEQFFRRLKNEFPELTPGDLKLAAYLRMNLSSKEIAPLLNISVRSVENKRYRLRKKLGLGEAENLLDFMLRY
ncbi:MAG TPA: triple tyrosine motif-containing protein [Saprospiraceae bacterium]|nr:triple tyrosine motif-containing protein [Saprospiraceae bacterium]HMP23372.1 triple tyrosine motif-containing protein [Saprospiraceae bacterium]